jgi:hypothetical protein
MEWIDWKGRISVRGQYRWEAFCDGDKGESHGADLPEKAHFPKWRHLFIE